LKISTIPLLSTFGLPFEVEVSSSSSSPGAPRMSSTICLAASVVKVLDLPSSSSSSSVLSKNVRSVLGTEKTVGFFSSSGSTMLSAPGAPPKISSMLIST